MNISKGNITLHMTQGADWAMTVRKKHPDGTAWDLTGKKCKMDIVTNVGAPAVLSLSSEGASPRIVITPSTGTISFTLMGLTQTILLKQARLEYDVFLYDATNSDCMFGGVVEVTLQRTK